MHMLKYIVLWQIILNSLTLTRAQWCVNFKSVIKTRIQWNNGQRLVSKRNFFGGIKYKYEPYVYSSVQNYHDYERINVCCDGYTKVSDSKCEPACKPSCPNNTHCIRPNICECNVGYRGYTASATNIQCEPFCKPACDQNAQCIEPNKCSCNKGYQDADGSGKCEPICEKECPENSSCTKPNQCTCNSGYFDNGKGQCKPVCSQKCPDYSECTKPDTCTCQPNYKENEGKCEPICEPACPQYAQCSKPNECECQEGYQLIDKVNATSITCIAKCDTDCPAFANCTQPNICECQQGYAKTELNLCEPVCENACPEHSNCSEPNTCSCDKGYVMFEQHCKPVCEKACPDHATCSEPNKCLCENGYQIKLSSIYNLYCEPVCQSNCSSFGKCVQPNKCECLEGYEMDDFESCQPVCNGGCKNGLCFKPEVCICKPGYLMGPQEECEPTCSMPCQNGSCVEPEICQCHEGFKLKSNSINSCEPVCKPDCINGICAAPNVCICHENYEPTKTEKGLNHSDCQLIQTTSSTVIKYTITTTEVLLITKQVEENMAKTSISTINPTTTTHAFSTAHPDLLRRTSAATLASAEKCQEKCKCWKEFDEFGPLVTKKCAHLCADAFDQPCLDLKLCQCDLVKNQLACRTLEDESVSDDPIYYKCNLPLLSTTNLDPDKGEGVISSDMKIERLAEKTKLPLWGLVALAGLVVVCVVAGLLYVYFRKVEDPIIEYEL